MSYLNRNTSKKTGASAELLYLVFVLAAGAATFWYFGHKIGLDLSSITTAADILGIGQSAARYDPRAPQQSTTTLEQVAVRMAAGDQEQAQAPTAPYCNPGQSPSFVNGMSLLHQQVGAAMGTPVECEHPSSGGGDTIQQTTTGLAVYDRGADTVSFTDGWHHWALRAGSVVTWEGTQGDPPTG